MKRKQMDRDIVVLLMTTLIMAFTWVGFETYRAYVKSTSPGDVDKFLEVLDPTLDQAYLDKLDSRNL